MIRRSLAIALAAGVLSAPLAALAQAPGYQPPAAAPAGAAAVLKIKQGTLKGASANGSGGGCGNMQRMEAEGSVYYVTSDGQKIRANKAVYEAGSTVVTMTGDVIAVRGQNVLRGDRMVFNTQTGEGQVEGTSKGRGAKDRPRGVFYPEQSNATSDKPK